VRDTGRTVAASGSGRGAMFLYRSLDRRASQKRARVMRQRARQTPERKKSGPPSGCHPTHGRGFVLAYARVQ
jgi:hypothetical protein